MGSPLEKPTLERWLLEGEGLPPWKSFVGLDSSAMALLLSAIPNRSDKPLVVIFPEKAAAHALVEDLRFFLGGNGRDSVFYIPPIEFDYHRGVLPSQEDISNRNKVLYSALAHPEKKIFVAPIAAILQKAMPPEAFKGATLKIRPNDELDREGLVQQLIRSGYRRQPIAYDPGVFSVRGGVIDVFSPVHKKPVRIEFYGDLVEAIRHYDPDSQRSLDLIEEAILIPVGMGLIPDEKHFPEVAEGLKSRLDTLGIAKLDRDKLIEEIRGGKISGSSEFLFPNLTGGSASLFDYFPTDRYLFWGGKEVCLESAIEREIPRLENNQQLYEKEPAPISKLEELFLNADDFEALVNQEERSFFFESFSSGDKADQVSLFCDNLSLQAERSQIKKVSGAHLEPLANRLKAWREEGYRVHIVSHTRTHSERILSLLEPYGLVGRVYDEVASFPTLLQVDFRSLHLWQAYLNKSSIYPSLKLILLSEEEIFGQKRRSAKTKATTPSTTAKNLAAFRNMKVGDYVVHRDHGIGKYLGLKSMSFQNIEADYVLLEYKDNDKLYIPVYRLNVLQKYAGEGVNVPLDKLGGDRWERVKKKAELAVAQLAAEFLKIHAKRKLIPAHQFAAPPPEYLEFEMEFPYDETPDQLKAIEEVNADLMRTYPMDRLIVGDVGYGKTEVAMRAAFRAVLEKKQVAILVPTTVLAFQHFENFKTRFKNSGIIVEMVSRLRTSGKNKETVEKLNDGKIDVIVGTHRLLSADVKFKDLGLVVVDEEHRFGVAHKEKLKKLSESVHYLSMTATPIPRTLNMAMSGIRDITLITTPPPDRLAVRTFVSRRSDEVMVDAISTEIGRGGQVFFVHNRIQSIFEVKDELRRLFPKAHVEIVHGQMDPDELEKKMLAFHHNEFQILLTTAIIESGVDIPRVNTIIIDRADTFGLAQLYQLRGRVGRSDKRAYCYLLVPGERNITDEAKERLQVLQRYTDLGAGFSVASHDMDIRGAGDLLGKEQHGNLNAVGVDLYFELLEDAVNQLRGAEIKNQIEPEINLRVAAYFPTAYLPDVGERIVLYRRLSDVASESEIAAIEEELRDRFGAPPEEVVNLLGLMYIKLLLKQLHVTHMNCGPKKASLMFAESTPVEPQQVIKLIKEAPDQYSLTPDQKLVFNAEATDWRGMLKQIERLCDKLLV